MAGETKGEGRRRIAHILAPLIAQELEANNVAILLDALLLCAAELMGASMDTAANGRTLENFRRKVFELEERYRQEDVDLQRQHESMSAFHARLAIARMMDGKL